MLVSINRLCLQPCLVRAQPATQPCLGLDTGGSDSAAFGGTANGLELGLEVGFAVLAVRVPAALVGASPGAGAGAVEPSGLRTAPDSGAGATSLLGSGAGGCAAASKTPAKAKVVACHLRGSAERGVLASCRASNLGVAMPTAV